MKLNSLTISKFNVREQIDEPLDNLINSIKGNDLLSKIILRKKGDEFEILCGSRRYRALLKLKGEDYDLPEDMYVVKDVEDKEALLIAVQENQQRKSLSPMELNRAILLLNHNGYKDKQIASILDITPHRLKRLANLSADIKRMPDKAKEELKKPLDASKLTDAHWDKIRSVEDAETIKDVVDYILEKEAPPREIPSIIKSIKPPEPKEASKKEESSASPNEGPIEYAHKGQLVLELKDGKKTLKVIGKGEDKEVPIDHYMEYLEHPQKFACYVTFKMKVKPIE